MKNFLFISFLIINLLTFTAYSATYKINQNGKVSSQSKVQTKTNYYNNYTPQSYINSNAVNNSNAPVIAVVMDFSGSMSNLIEIAKRTMYNILAQVPSSTKIGLRVFGHKENSDNKMGAVQSVKAQTDKNGKKKYVVNTGKFIATNDACKASRQLASITPVNANSFNTGLNSVSIGSSTPLTYALQNTVSQDFSGLALNYPKKIILITDGGENCGGDPCAFARALMRQRSDIQIDVILVSSLFNKLTCLSDTTGGTFYNLRNLSDFPQIMVKTINEPSSKQIQTSPNNNNQSYEFINN